MVAQQVSPQRLKGKEDVRKVDESGGIQGGVVCVWWKGEWEA